MGIVGPEPALFTDGAKALAEQHPLEDEKLATHDQKVHDIGKKALKAEQNDLLADIMALDPNARVLGQTQLVMNAIMVEADASVLAALAGNPAVARIAAKVDAAVVPVFCRPTPDPGHFVLRFDEAIVPSELPEEERSVERLTGRFVDVTEREIRRHPALWLWMHNRWQ